MRAYKVQNLIHRIERYFIKKQSHVDKETVKIVEKFIYEIEKIF